MNVDAIGELEAAEKDSHDQMALGVSETDVDGEAAEGEGTSAKYE